VALAAIFLSLLVLISQHALFTDEYYRRSELIFIDQKFMQSEREVSGHHSNPRFGLTDIVFPDGWHGTEIPSLIGLIVNMHPGTRVNP
jgi:hypothetical protein